MIPFKIGNWLIDQEGIKWDGKPKTDYLIAKARLTEAGPQGRSKMYDWLVHMPEKTWLTRADIYALNTALIYAMEEFKIPFPKNLSFVETFEQQEKELKGK
jgi:hypothetical protein